MFSSSYYSSSALSEGDIWIDLKIEETSAVASWSWGLDEPKDKPSQTGSHDDSTGLLR